MPDEIENTPIPQRILFFDYWDELPITKRIDSESYNTIWNSRARSLIISIISKGLNEKYPNSEIVRKRRALNAKEIGNLLEKQHDLKLKKANLYFHLQKLEDTNLLSIVDTVRRGKRFTAYYGRTARIFLSGEDLERSSYRIFKNENFLELIKILNNNKLPENFESMIQQLTSLDQFDVKVFETWVKEHQAEMHGLEIELYEFYKLFSIIHRFNTEVGEGLENLSEMLYYKRSMLSSSDEIFQRDQNSEDETIILTNEDIENYWRSIGIMKIFPNSVYTKILGSKQVTDKGTIIRSSIVKVMQDGLLDTLNGSIRHAFTAKEILDKMNEPIYLEIIDLQTTLQQTPSNKRMIIEALELQRDLLASEVLKKSNLYFHLQKLEEEGFIREIGFIKTGKRHKAYFGVTAKILSPTNFIDEPTYPILQNQVLVDLASRISNNVELGKLSATLKELQSLNEYRVELFQVWTSLFGEALSELELDYSELSKLMMISIRFTKPIIANLTYLAKVLKIEQNGTCI